jgi:hypothetical protein
MNAVFYYLLQKFDEKLKAIDFTMLTFSSFKTFIVLKIIQQKFNEN